MDKAPLTRVWSRSVGAMESGPDSYLEAHRPHPSAGYHPSPTLSCISGMRTTQKSIRHNSTTLIAKRRSRHSPEGDGRSSQSDGKNLGDSELWNRFRVDRLQGQEPETIPALGDAQETNSTAGEHFFGIFRSAAGIFSDPE